jgi:hypothetical protein
MSDLIRESFEKSFFNSICKREQNLTQKKFN